MNLTNIIIHAAKSIKISTLVLLAICNHESHLKNTIRFNDGGSNTYGVCMVKYKTAVMLGYKGDPYGLMRPKTNALYAAKYLKFQYKKYKNYCKAIAAYNAGHYNASIRRPGYPRNLGYVLEVKKEMNKHFRKIIYCVK